MLTNLEWLVPGGTYPPPQEKKRIEAYEINEKLFLTQHSEVWKGDYEELAKYLKNKARDVDTILNYQQLLSKKIADFVCGEPPDVGYSDNNTLSDAVNNLLSEQEFWAKLYEATIDISRFGNGVGKIVGDRFSVASAKYWFPIVDPTDLKHIVCQVIAYPTDPDKNGEMKTLYVEIHYRDRTELKWFGFNKGKIGAEKEAPVSDIESGTRMPQVIKNPLDDFAVQPLTNVTHSGDIYGVDDYAIVNSLVRKIIWRLHRADIIMDKHSEPSMTGPKSALDYDERTKSYYLNLANYFSRTRAEDPDVKYLTWDGNLDSNFREIDMLLEQLYTLSEMGTAFMEGGDAGATSSGTALRLRLVSPRVKAQRIAGINDSRVRRIIAMLCQANGIKIDTSKLSLVWHDGLPNDEVEDANRRNIETAGKQVKAIRTAIRERVNSDDEADAEYERIREEQASAMPTVLSQTPTNETDPPPGEDDDIPPDDGPLPNKDDRAGNA